MDPALAIEKAVAISATILAEAFGAVILFYVILAFVYGRLIRKYRYGVLFLGLAISIAAFILGEFVIDVGRQYLFATVIVSCFVGIELADLLLTKFRKKPGDTV